MIFALTLEKLSEKQKLVLKWAHEKKTREKYDAIICDGAVRSGKTIVMIVSFIHWAMRFFSDSAFGICGRSIGSVERNIIEPLLQIADITEYYSIELCLSKNVMIIKNGRQKNTFYLFGGNDEQSYMSIQGITLSGILLDEVALMPRSFVEQSIARTLSVKNSKLWFNCNPEGPNHWFYKEWILQAKGKNEKRILHLHFLMEDNPILDESDIKKAKSLYEGVFLRRYIYGEWVAAEGLVYPMFSEINHGDYSSVKEEKLFVSIDYGTRNPCSMGLWNVTGKKAYRIDEFYYDSQKTGRQLTDEEYYNHLLHLCKNRAIKSVVVDPSASSFIALIRKKGRFNVISAKNNVTDGIRITASFIKSGQLLIDDKCIDILREFSLYSWDKNSGSDCVVKEYDHAMDDMRYFCNTVLKRQVDFYDDVHKKYQIGSYSPFKLSEEY